MDARTKAAADEAPAEAGGTPRSDSAPAKTAEAYQTGQDMPAYLWRIAK